LGSYPLPGLLNLLIEPGQQSLPALMATLDHAIVVDQVLGSDAGISGELSINVELGYYLKQGEILGRVKDTMVAGNVYTALKHLIALSKERLWNGSCYTPAIAVDSLSVTGRS
jgi:PmbA protein